MLFAARMVFLFWGDIRELCWCAGHVMVVYSVLGRCRGRTNALYVEWGVEGSIGGSGVEGGRCQFAVVVARALARDGHWLAVVFSRSNYLGPSGERGHACYYVL